MTPRLTGVWRSPVVTRDMGTPREISSTDPERDRSPPDRFLAICGRAGRWVRVRIHCCPVPKSLILGRAVPVQRVWIPCYLRREFIRNCAEMRRFLPPGWDDEGRRIAEFPV